MPIPAITSFTVATASAFALSTTTIALSSATSAFFSAFQWRDGPFRLH